MTASAQLTRADFPALPANRYFTVKHNPKSVSTPVTIELRQFLTEQAAEQGMLGMSRLLGIQPSTAVREDLLEAAQKLLYRVGNIDNVVGVYA